ncbi:MAG: methyltransferase, partial [Roseovarius sp.]
MVEDLKRRTRSGGRAGGVARRGNAVIEQMPWNPPINRDRPTEPLTDAGVLAIHD